MKPLVMRSVAWKQLWAAFLKWDAKGKPIATPPRSGNVTLLWTVVGDGIVVPTNAIWFDGNGKHVVHPVSALVGLHLFTAAEVDEIRAEWHDRRRELEDIAAWLSTPMADVLKGFGVK